MVERHAYQFRAEHPSLLQPTGIGAVSYTHLDVYKRQALVMGAAAYAGVTCNTRSSESTGPAKA